MITKTSLKNPVAIQNIKKAILAAVKAAPSSPGGVSIQPVYNRKGRIYLAVIGIKGKGYKIQNTSCDEVTDMVNEAMREYHEQK